LDTPDVEEAKDDHEDGSDTPDVEEAIHNEDGADELRGREE